MSSKAAPEAHDDSDFESVDSNQSDSSSVSISLKVEEAIKNLPTLPDKLQAIAINSHIQHKRQLDAQLEKDQYKIEHDSTLNYQPQLLQIKAIVEGTYDYQPADLEFIIKDHAQLFTTEQLAVVSTLDLLKKTCSHFQDTGAPRISMDSYWLKCLQNSDIVGEQVHENDKNLLSFLTYLEGDRNEQNTKLTIIFHFAENEWITNSVLKKQFDLDDKAEPTRSYGDKVEWKDGKNYTVKTIKKKKKNKKQESNSKTVKVPSFFHFFEDIDSKDDMESDMGEDECDDLVEDLQLQFELCEHLYRDLIPRSLEYFLGCSSEGLGIPAHTEALEPVEEGSEDSA